MKNIVYSFLVLILPLSLWGQDATQARSLQDQALAAIETGDLETAHNLFTEASTIYEQTNQWADYLNCGVELVDNLIKAGEYDLGVENAQNFIAKAEQKKHKDISLSLLHKKLGTIYYLQDDYKAAVPYLEQALKIRESLDPNDPDLARDYGNIGIISRYTGRFNRAIEFLNKATTLQKDNNVLARLYSELGTNYKFLGNYRKSLDHFNQAILLLKDGADLKAQATALLEKGTILTELEQENEDLIYINQAIKIFNNPTISDYINLTNCYHQTAISYLLFSNDYTNAKNAKLDSAFFYGNQALEMASKFLAPDHELKGQILLTLSSIFMEKGQWDQASNMLNQCPPNNQNLYNAVVLETRSRLLAHQKSYNEALIANQQEMMTLLDGYTNADIHSLPSIKDIKNTLSQNYMAQALALKARYWYAYYQQSNNKQHLDEALKTSTLFDELVDHIRADFSNSGSNIAWSAMTINAYENAIEICLALAQNSGDASYKEKALYFSEKSKGLTLLEAFQNTKASSVAGLSEQDLIKEREMKLDISDLEQEVFQLIQQGKPELQEKIVALNKKIFIKKEAYQSFLSDLEQNNPQYYQTKYQLNILNLEQIRALLKDDQGVVEYFVGDSSIYAFKITKTEFEVYTLDGQESMLARVNDFRKSIYGFFLSSKDRSDQMKSKYAQQYSNRSHQMYQKLVAPLGALPKRLIIIPAGPMCDMPFEPLLTEPVTELDKYKQHPYLLRNHVISYAYSATLLKEMMHKEHAATTGTYVGFAPSFGKTAASLIRGKRFALSPLAYNQPEIENIQALLGSGTVFKDGEATEDQFKQIASDYQIIHFATHGMANSKDPDFSLLAFTEVPDDKENEFLYVSDLYNLELQADMVVLSACETALGKNFKGEGIMSLARGFSYAGAKSIFTTLWSVNDHSTYNIIKGFYYYLQQGMDKDEALQQSKLDYISRANNFTAHPFLWSPYILVGDTNSIPAITKGLPWLSIIGVVVGGILLLFFGFNIAKKKEIV